MRIGGAQIDCANEGVTVTESEATFVAACVAACAAIVAAIFAALSTRKTNYTNAIVASRIRWISELRDDFSALYSDAEQIFGSESTRQHEDGLKLSRNYLASSLKLRLKLNPRDDREILGLLENLEQAVLAACKGEDWTNIDREKLIPQIQDLLKREWDKSKREAASVW